MAVVNERHKIVRELLKIMTKEELAGKVGVSVFTIMAWRDTRRIPSFAAFFLLKKIHKQKIK